MREADVAIRLRQPTQPDLIQRKLFSVHFHAYASPEYVKRFGTPRALEELDSHRIIVLGGTTVPTYLQNRNWLIEVARDGKGPRSALLHISNVLGVLRACQRGVGIALLPGLSGRGERWPGAAIRRDQCAGARRLLRLSRRTQVGRARSGLSRLPGGEGPALAFLGLRLAVMSFGCAFPLRSRDGRASRESGLQVFIFIFFRPRFTAWLACRCWRCPIRSSARYSVVAVGERLPILPDRNRNADSCSPLEGDCRPPRRQTLPDPQGSGFSCARKACLLRVASGDLGLPGRNATFDHADEIIQSHRHQHDDDDRHERRRGVEIVGGRDDDGAEA